MSDESFHYGCLGRHTSRQSGRGETALVASDAIGSEPAAKRLTKAPKGYVPILVGDEGDEIEERFFVHIKMLRDPSIIDMGGSTHTLGLEALMQSIDSLSNRMSISMHEEGKNEKRESCSLAKKVEVESAGEGDREASVGPASLRPRVMFGYPIG
ncbi:hypothetical protein MA16_Dca009182 [Dendrobium catenatum]|uniref:Uncharacterized protein n=1 Tax=Dendrobium catenatum TaxID=906689 RepID=A0A2I0VR48_9ASPA|nr:hypothetical protein MA16_Dca009182 [Dendrobium catenatum]